MNAQQHYAIGNLRSAIAEINEEIKCDATNIAKRSFLMELLCIAGDLDRASKQLDTLTQQSPHHSINMTIIRQLIRAELTRRECFNEGRLPEFVGELTRDLHYRIQAITEIRRGNFTTANEILKTAEQQFPNLTGYCNLKSFSAFRDLDDICAYIFEAFTSNGKYYWIPIDKVKTITFSLPTRPLDLLWRTAEIEIIDGPEGTIHIPATYYSWKNDLNDALKLGQETVWRGNGPIFGLGQRTFLVGDNDMPMMNIKSLKFINN